MPRISAVARRPTGQPAAGAGPRAGKHHDFRVAVNVHGVPAVPAPTPPRAADPPQVDRARSSAEGASGEGPNRDGEEYLFNCFDSRDAF